MLLILTVLLLSAPQDPVASTSSAEQLVPQSVQLQASTTSFSPETFSSSRTTESPEEGVAYQPGRVEPQPVSSDAASSARDPKDAQLGTRDVSSLPLPAPPRKLRRRVEVSPAQRRAWYALMFAGHGAATFDVWSTRRAITRDGGRELNPLLKPFAHSNALYVAGQVSPALMDYLGHRMMTSRHPWVRRMWWLPQGANAAASIVCGVHNVRLVH